MNSTKHSKTLSQLIHMAYTISGAGFNKGKIICVRQTKTYHGVRQMSTEFTPSKNTAGFYTHFHIYVCKKTCHKKLSKHC